MALVVRPLEWSSPRLGEATIAALDGLPSVGGTDGARHLLRGPGGERVIYYPGNRIVRIEGRVSAMLARDEGVHTLGASLDCARVAEHVAERHLRELTGLRIEGERSEVARLDVAVDVRGTRDGGLAVLRALRATSPPRSKWLEYTNPVDRLPETVGFVTVAGGKPVMRAYDKGLESGGAWGRGERIRLERQDKVGDRKRRLPPSAITGGHLAKRWGTHTRAIAEHASTVTVGTSEALAVEVASMVRSGALSPARARGLLGAVHLLPELEREAGGSSSEAQRQRRTLRRWHTDLVRAGLLLAQDSGADAVRVPVPELLRDGERALIAA